MWPTADTTGNDLPSLFPEFVQFFFQLSVFGMAYHLVLPHCHPTGWGSYRLILWTGAHPASEPIG